MNHNSSPISLNWTVYMILCSDNTIYTGITIDLTKRFNQHATLKGAKYFRSRKPVEVIYAENGHSRSTASKREFALKRLKHSEKLLLASEDIEAIAK